MSVSKIMAVLNSLVLVTKEFSESKIAKSPFLHLHYDLRNSNTLRNR